MASQPLIIYTRVSRRGDREDGKYHSPATQAERAKAFAASRGYAVYPEPIVDEDVSGGKHPLERPGMAHVLEEIREGRAGGVVAYDGSRLSRDQAHGAWLVQEVAKHGGVVLAPDLPEDMATAAGVFQSGILFAVSQYQRQVAGERLQIEKERATREGILVGNTVPLGYRKGDDRRMVLDPETAPLVAELYERRVAGDGWGALAAWLSEQTGGRAWAKQSVARIIANPLYHRGRIALGDVVSDFEAGAIVDAATWTAAQSPKQVRDGRSARGKWLLSGLLRCANCGHALIPWTPSTKERRTTANRYRCTFVGCPERVSIHAPAAEDLVTEAAFAESRKLVSRPPEAVDLAPLEEAMARTEMRLEQMLAPESQDALGDAWAATAKERRLERDAAAAALGEARAKVEAATGGRDYELGHLWDDLDPEQQRAALRWHFAEVRVAKVPRGEKPALTFVPAATRPFRIEFAPVDVVPG